MSCGAYVEGSRMFVGHALPFMREPTKIAAGSTYYFGAVTSEPLYVSRIRWSAAPGLQLMGVKLGRQDLSQREGVIAELNRDGTWRFPALPLQSGVQCSAIVFCSSAASVFLHELTLWGVPKPLELGRP